MRSLVKVYSTNEVDKNEFMEFERRFSLALTNNVKDFIKYHHGSIVKETLFFDQRHDLYLWKDNS